MRLNKLFLAIFAAGAAILSCSCGGGGGGGSTPPDDPPPGQAWVRSYTATTQPGGNVEYVYGPRTSVEKGATAAQFADAATPVVIANLKAWLASGNAPTHFAGIRKARSVFLIGHGSQVFDNEIVVENYILQNEAQVAADLREAIFYKIDIHNDPDEPGIIERITMVSLEFLPG